MSQTVLPWVADALVVLAVVTLSIAVYGLIWIPNLYVRLHATNKVVPLGIVPILAAVSVFGDPAIVARAFLIGVLLIITTPVSAHAVAYAISREMEAEQGVETGEEETERHLDEHEVVTEA